MQQNEYMNAEQTLVNERVVNTDPREQVKEYDGGTYSPHAKLQPRPRKRAPWRTVLFCVVALAVAIGIAELTGGIPISSMQKTLPARVFSLSGRGSLVVNENSGTVHVHAGDTSQIIVRATEYAYGLGNDLNDLQVQYTQQGNTLTVNANESWGIVLGNRGINLDITVPSSIDLALHGSSGDINLTGVDGKIDVNTDSGSLSLNNVNGPLDLSTSSGDITVINESGPVSAHADSGDIRLDHASGVMNLSTSSGNITLDQAQVSGQDLWQTDSGSIQFTGTLDPHGTYQMETDSGNVTLNLPANTSFQLTTSTDSGSVSNAFTTSTVGNAPHAGITAKTDSGDIRVQKQ
jgi:Putative adhesin